MVEAAVWTKWKLRREWQQWGEGAAKEGVVAMPVMLLVMTVSTMTVMMVMVMVAVCVTCGDS